MNLYKSLSINNLTWLFLSFLFIGGNLYIYDSAFSLMNLFFVSIFLLYAIYFYKNKFDEKIVILTSIILLYNFCSLFYLIFNFKFDIEELKDFFYQLYIPIIFIFIVWFINNGKNPFKTILKISFLFLILTFFIVIFELLTNIHLPNHNSSKDFIYLPTGFYSNPNDLSSVVVLFFPFLFYFAYVYNYKLIKIIIVIITVFIVLITMSRLSLILLLVFPFFFFVIKEKYKKLIILTIFTALLIFGLFKIKPDYINKNNDDNIVIRNTNRMISVLHYSEQSSISKSSISIRNNIYLLPFINPNEYIIGKGFQSSKKILSQYPNFNTTNPHSLFIETIFNFGWIGLIILIMIIFYPLIYGITNFSLNEYYRYGVIQIFYFIILINVPSTVIRFPIIWVPFSIASIMILNNKKIHQNE